MKLNIDGQGNLSPANLSESGATEKIKVARWLNRSVKVGGYRVKKRDMIEHLNTKLPEGKQLDKRWFIGSSNREVRKAFNTVYPSQGETVTPFKPVVLPDPEVSNKKKPVN